MDPGLKPLEFWGGVECTNARLADRRVDQLAWLRLEPEALADLVVSLGISRVRFPILWERVAPRGLISADWSWTDRALGRLRERGVDVIAGLVHHGSGPDDTNLLDPGFPTRLAMFAYAVARRYPWITAYTPVNEPLTTARFSALYGIWYPLRSDPTSFATALFTQCAAIARAMEAIRAIVPDATLVVTEDLAKVHATPHMAYQAANENLRRWASIDLLSGIATANAVVVDLAAYAGISDFTPYTCVPDIIGFNYYVTSERFLDHRIERYPHESLGTNGTDAYADVTAARVCIEGPVGLDTLLREAAGRYAIPLAVTEAHLGCTREEQLRWLEETLDATHRARASGCDVRAFTFWSLLGTREWNSLLRRADGHYEVGAFDARVEPPRPTAIASFIRKTTAGTTLTHPATPGPGWWRAMHRFEHPPVVRGDHAVMDVRDPVRRRSVLIVGGKLSTRSAFARACTLRSLEAFALGAEGCAPSDRESVERAISAASPWAVILCVANFSGQEATEQIAATAAACEASDIDLAIVADEGKDAPANGDARALIVETDEATERAVHPILDLLIDGERGTWRIAADGTPSNEYYRPIPAPPKALVFSA